MQQFILNKYKVKQQHSPSWIMFSIIIIVGGFDLSGDYIDLFGLSRFTFMQENNYIQYLSFGLIIIIGIIGINNILRNKYSYKSGIGAKLFLLLFSTSVVLGAIVGLIKGNLLSYVIGDSRNLIVYLALFAIDDTKWDGFENKLYKLYLFVCAIVLLKLLIALASFLVITSSPLSVRFLLKLTPYLIGIALINVALMTNKFESKKYIIFVVATISVVLSQTRGLLLGYACGFVVLCIVMIFMKRGVQIIIPGMTLLVLAIILSATVWFNVEATHGKWTGDIFDDTVAIRLEQIDSFMNLFKNHPIFGIGLGGYDPEYLRFDPETRRPYLQELEFHNLLAKLGIVGIYFWLLSFLSLFYECWRRIKITTSIKIRGLISGFMAGLVGMLVASSTNPYYSSIYFHTYVVMILLLLSKAMRSDKSVNITA